MALKKSMGVELLADNPLVDWLAEKSARPSKQCEIGNDSRPYVRVTRKRADLVGTKLGEPMHWKGRVAGGALRKLVPIWHGGMLLGLKGDRRPWRPRGRCRGSHSKAVG